MLSVMENLRSLDSDYKGGHPLQSSLEVLVTELLYKDTHFLLSCLLSLEVQYRNQPVVWLTYLLLFTSQPKSFDKVCSLFPPSCQLSHQIPLYVTCLKLYSQFTLPLNNRYDGKHNYCNPSVFSRLVAYITSSIYSGTSLSRIHVLVDIFLRIFGIERIPETASKRCINYYINSNSVL